MGEKEYLNLVKKVKKYYKDSNVIGGVYSQTDTETNNKIKKEFKLLWCDECKEINLWTYWQGHKNKQAKILVLGQDWSSPWNQKTGCLYDYVYKFLEDDSKCSQNYIDQIKKIKMPTDIMLQDLLCSLGEEYDPFISDNKNLFFSNLCLGYRDCGASGGLNKNVLLHDVEYAKDLIKIVKPKLIICLGKDTYDVMVKGTGSIEKSKDKSFYKKLSSGNCYAMYDNNIPIFGQAHTGSLGIMNRWRYNPEKSEYSEERVKQLLIDDWKIMKEFL